MRVTSCENHGSLTSTSRPATTPAARLGVLDKQCPRRPPLHACASRIEAGARARAAAPGAFRLTFGTGTHRRRRLRAIGAALTARSNKVGDLDAAPAD